MNPRTEPWTQIPGQAPGNLTQKTHPLNPPLLPREGEAEGGGEFIKFDIQPAKIKQGKYDFVQVFGSERSMLEQLVGKY